MKKILLVKLGAAATEAGVRSWLSCFGPVGNVAFVRDGDAKALCAIVAMDVSDGQASFIVSRISNCRHAGSLVGARVLAH